MKDPFTFEPGRVVESIQGRDRGGFFLVLENAGGDIVMIADGSRHRLAHPKKKKTKHLRAKPVLLDLKRLRPEGGKLQDSDLRRALEANGFAEERRCRACPPAGRDFRTDDGSYSRLPGAPQQSREPLFPAPGGICPDFCGFPGYLPREKPSPFGETDPPGRVKKQGVGPNTCIRPAAGLRPHRRQPMRTQARRCARHGPDGGPKGARTGARSLGKGTRDPFGRDGGTGTCIWGRATKLLGWAPIRREAPDCCRTDKKVSGRREAQRERRPADGAHVLAGWAGDKLHIRRGRAAPGPHKLCRIMHPALVRPGQSTDRTCTGGSQFGAKRHHALGTDQQDSGRREAERERRSADGVSLLLLLLLC